MAFTGGFPKGPTLGGDRESKFNEKQRRPLGIRSSHRSLIGLRDSERIGDANLSAIQHLTQAGFSDNDLSVFIGTDGLAKLDLHGKKDGIMGRIVRAADSLTSNQQANQEAEDALKTGSAYVTVLTDGGEEQKRTAERILKAHHANNVRYYGQWTVEPL